MKTKSILTLWSWQNSNPLRTWYEILLTSSSGRPLGYFSRSSNTVRSTNSNTKNNLRFRRNTSNKLTRFSWRSCWQKKEGIIRNLKILLNLFNYQEAWNSFRCSAVLVVQKPRPMVLIRMIHENLKCWLFCME